MVQIELYKTAHIFLGNQTGASFLPACACQAHVCVAPSLLPDICVVILNMKVTQAVHTHKDYPASEQDARPLDSDQQPQGPGLENFQSWKVRRINEWLSGS